MTTQSRWSTEEARESLMRTEQTFVRKINSAWSGFLNFALRDNVLEVAVGLMGLHYAGTKPLWGGDSMEEGMNM
ncbi:hypothetical protein D9619_011209 [Psilocybe cf. subviscida]|uniref:Uncharacterized protein n=1 Tax=Psilocybe cf. subviscida TaxID=2480587 RepID=A0A8H5BKK1_9AGAR|nr:hypothetical protein D9619_011209 [Psilocybe cf. subviscida]